MDNTRDLLGKNLKKLRIKKRWTQEELAEKCKLSAKMIQKIEYGQVSPSLETLDSLSEALSARQVELFQDDSQLESLTSVAAFLSKFAETPLHIQKAVLMLVYKDANYLKDAPESVIRDATKLLKSLVAL